MQQNKQIQEAACVLEVVRRSRKKDMSQKNMCWQTPASFQYALRWVLLIVGQPGAMYETKICRDTHVHMHVFSTNYEALVKGGSVAFAENRTVNTWFRKQP